MENKTSVAILIIVIIIAGIFVAWRLMKIGSVTVPVAGTSSSAKTGSPATPASLPMPPGANASKDEFNQFGQKINAMAQNTNVLEIGAGCVVSPLVARMNVGAQLTFKNNDSIVHKISVGEVSDIPAHGQKTTTAQLKGPGIYGVNCDGTHLVGFLELVK